MDFLNSLFSLSATSVTLCGAFFITLTGYALGSIRFKGLQFGAAGVFLMALLFGYLFTVPALQGIPVLSKFYIAGPDAAVVDQYGYLESIGLILFVTSVGFIAGPSFFRNLKVNAKSYVPLATIIVFTGVVFTVLFAMIPGIGADYANGILSGALTSTPAFSAAKQVAENQGLVSLGHAVAYPFGVVGVVLFVQIIPRLVKADLAAEREAIKIVKTDTSEIIENNEKKGKLLDEFGFSSFGVAVILGIFLGSIKIPLTGAGFGGACFSLGNTGGPLIIALICGHFGRIGKLSLEVPAHVVKTFREFGLTLFLIGAGVEGGVELVAQVQASEYGVMLLIYGFIAGAFMTTVPLLVGYLCASRLFKLRLLNNLGALTGGMTSTPALGTLIKVAGTDDVASAYASAYPVALVLIVIASNFIGTFL